jgi:CheY-like chemotaxis protein
MNCATSASQSLCHLVDKALTPLRLALSQIELLEEEQFDGLDTGFKQAFVARARALLNLQPEVKPRFKEQRVLVALKPGPLQAETCNWLRSWGLEPHTVKDCPSAYRSALQSNRLGLVLLDDQLDGFQGNGSIQSIRQAGGAPVLVLAEVQPTGADGWWPQPHDSQHLLRLLEHFLQAPTKSAPKSKGELGRQHPLKILIAEDLALNQKLIGLLLSRLGYPADAANNGYEVMLKVEQEEYDLILMDLNMPGMNGLEAASRVRQLKPLEAGGPRLVAMSANLPNGTPQGSGFEEFLAKPVQLDGLQAILRNCPSRNRQTGTDGLLPILDPTILENLKRLGDQDFLESLIDDAAQELPQMLGLLMDSWQRGDNAQVVQLAHGIKGSAATLGAARVARLAGDIEQQAKTGRLNGEPLTELETALEEALLCLQREDQLPSS